MENIFSSFAFSAQGLSVQRMRLSSVAKNIANADTTRDERGQVYRREVVVVRARQRGTFEDALQLSLPLARSSPSHVDPETPGLRAPDDQILKAQVARDNSPPRMVYDPTHPDANAEGYCPDAKRKHRHRDGRDDFSAACVRSQYGVIAAAKNIARDSLEI